MSWWQRLGAWGVAIEAEMGNGTNLPPGAAPMIVGTYVGLVLGTLHPEYGAEIRREIEAELGTAMGLPAEQLESVMRQLIAQKTAKP